MGNCLGNVLPYWDTGNESSPNSCDYCKTHGDAVKDLCYCTLSVSRFFKHLTKPVQPDVNTDSWMRDKPCYKWFTYDGMKVSYCRNQCVDSDCREQLDSSKDREGILRRKSSPMCYTRQKGNPGFSCYSKMKVTEASMFPVTIIRCLTPDDCFVKKC